MRRPKTTLALALAAALLADLAQAQPAVPDKPAQEAAMGELLRPDGVGGCIFLAVSVQTRREAMVSLMSGKGYSPALQKAVGEVAPRCAGRAYSTTDLTLVGAVISAFQRASQALALSQELAVGQQRLDAAWAAATPEEKAAFYTAAQDFLHPAGQVRQRPLDVGPFARRLQLPVQLDPRAEARLKSYYLHTALRERAEAKLAAEGARPAKP